MIFALASMWDAVMALGAWGSGIVVVILSFIWMFFGFLRWTISHWVGPAISAVVKSHTEFLSSLSASMRKLNESSDMQCSSLDTINVKLDEQTKILDGSGLKGCPIREDIEAIKKRISPETWERVRDSVIEEFRKKGHDVSKIL